MDVNTTVTYAAFLMASSLVLLTFLLLGGRAAERIVFGRISTGAADDLRKVTDIARAMVTQYGMVDEIGPVSYEREPRSFLNPPALALQPPPRREYSEATAEEIDRVVHDLVARAQDRAMRIL